METVQVDMQKLQLLNERIAQTFDALNQLRLSVHGFQHTPAQVGGWGYQAPYGIYNPIGFGSPFAQQGFAQQGFAQQPFVTSPYAAYTPGFQHTTAGWPITTTWSTPTWTTPSFTNGISHATWEPRPYTFTPTIY
jgi:hypothetical protein